MNNRFNNKKGLPMQYFRQLLFLFPQPEAYTNLLNCVVYGRIASAQGLTSA
jgi:hypothetical protein